MEPVLIVAADAGAAARRCAEELTRAAQRAVSDRGRALVALSGGTAVVPMLRYLASSPLAELFPWDSTDVFWSDDRCVPTEDPASNHGMAFRELFEHVPAPRERVHAPPVHLGSPAEIARAYEEELRRISGNSHPKFDMILLGLGTDGHTASLFPGADALDDFSRLVMHTKAPVAPHDRVTFGPSLLLDAERISLLVTGAGKAEIAHQVLLGEVDPKRYPTQILDRARGAVLWYLDPQSASSIIASQGNGRQQGGGAAPSW